MTQEYDNDLRGVLFKNDRKEKDTHPDYKGSCEIDEVEYWISAWIKEGRDGKKRMSLSFSPKEEQAPAPAPARRPTSRQASRDDDFDDAPF